MKKILIYNDAGVDALSLDSLLFSLKQEKMHQKFFIELINRHIFQTVSWQKETHLLIFPGGRDIPYHRALKGLRNSIIRKFVENGGNFFGICAGGYYGCSTVEFEKGRPLEVLAERELKFFPGIAHGPAYGPGKFDYRSEQGAQIASLVTSTSFTASYYNGGCSFVNAEDYDGITVLARYADIEKQPAAIIKCSVGNGYAVLSGVHPEYSAFHTNAEEKIKEPLFLALKQIETERRSLFSSVLNSLS